MRRATHLLVGISPPIRSNLSMGVMLDRPIVIFRLGVASSNGDSTSARCWKSGLKDRLTGLIGVLCDVFSKLVLFLFGDQRKFPECDD